MAIKWSVRAFVLAAKGRKEVVKSFPERGILAFQLMQGLKQSDELVGDNPGSLK